MIAKTAGGQVHMVVIRVARALIVYPRRLFTRWQGRIHVLPFPSNNIRNKNLAPGRHYGVSKRHSTGKMSFLALLSLSAITSSLLPPGDNPHLMCLPETLFRPMSPRDTLLLNGTSRLYGGAQKHSRTSCHLKTGRR